MPAVKAFALYAGMALLLDFMLQMTCFIGLFSLDTARQEVYFCTFSFNSVHLNVMLHCIHSAHRAIAWTFVAAFK